MLHSETTTSSSSTPSHVSGNLGMLSKLTGHNFANWSVSFTFLVKSQERKHHLTDDPPTSTDPSYADWEADDALVHTWLANSLSEKCLSVICHDETVKAAWDHLMSLYS